MSQILRRMMLAFGLVVLSVGAASACENCDGHDGYGYHDGYGDGYRHDGYRDGWHDGYRHDGYRDDRYACGDGCGRRTDGCRDNCYRHYDGCHDGCGRHRCYDRCGEPNYSCRSGFYDCRFEGSWSDERYRRRYYDAHPQWSGGGAYGFYGH